MNTSNAIAIIGMGCRFPGASSLEQFWTNLVNGVESITSFGPTRHHEAWQEVSSAGIVDNASLFDAALFGLSAREAERMDPQHRVFLECAWEALERSGYYPKQLPGRVGVFAGTGFNEYLVRNIMPLAPEGDLSLLLTNDACFLSSRLAYLLGCSGPAIAVSSACSTSLVAVHLAVQSLLMGECDTAICGGVRITTPQNRPYRHEPGGIGSSDGHCRAFDSAANGTVSGNGAGVVVLRRLDDARNDGDPIAAVILGSAVTNDGAQRVGFTAPGVNGQCAAICEAQALADVSPDSIGMLEAHGTATTLGDPVEFEALSAAFRHGTTRRGFCALGSVKTNIGHLDAAAGIAGLIKTVLALQHRVIPASLHFREPGSGINLQESPFFVTATARPWLEATRRAGVSSFGMGGTNAHIVLESAPEPLGDTCETAEPQLLELSARSEASLHQMAQQLADHLEREQPLLADVAYTLAVSRNAYEWKTSVECTSLAEAAEALRGPLQITRSSCAAQIPRASRRRIHLPATPFEHKHYWVDPPSSFAYRANPADWLYTPRLRQSMPLEQLLIDSQRNWLVLLDDHGVGQRIAAALRDAGAQTVVELVYTDDTVSDVIHTQVEADWSRPLSVISLWSLAAQDSSDDREVLQRHYLRPAQVLRAWADKAGGDVDVTFVVNGAFDGFGSPTAPEKAMLLGLARALRLEYPSWLARVMDVEMLAQDTVECILAEATACSADDAVIHKYRSRWVETVEPVTISGGHTLPIRRGGVYLVTGGNSGIGLAISRYLIDSWGAHVIALSRRGGQSGQGFTAVAANLDNIDELRQVVVSIQAEHGPINGLVHCAGMPPHALLRTATDAAVKEVFAGKFFGALNLQRVMLQMPLDFVVLSSSLRAHIPAAGSGDYMAANLALEALATSWAATGARVLSIAWDTWSKVGMAATASDARFVTDELDAEGMSVEEGVKLFEAASQCGLSRVVVSTRPFSALKAHAQEAFSVGRAGEVAQRVSSTRHPRPALNTVYIPARTALESQLAQIWSEILGYDTIGIKDDFFDLGGDSVATLQIVARAREQGLNLETSRAFEAHTIEEFAAATRIELAEELLLGDTPLPLSAAQQWLFACESGDINRFVQGVVINLPEGTDVLSVGAAIDAAVAHRRVLSVRFAQTESGWKQLLGASQSVAVEVHQYVGSPAGQLDHAIEMGGTLQRSMDIQAPLLVRAAIVSSPVESHLVIVVHHLLIDASGWRILLDDICARVADLGRATDVPDEAFLQWVIHLDGIAQDAKINEEEAAYWASLDLPDQDFPALRRKGSTGSLTSTLSVAQTRVLTSSRKSIEALLATAVAYALRPVAMSDRILIDIESLGRGWSRVPQDVSRAMGWFTAIHPLVIDTAQGIYAAAAQAATLVPQARHRAVAYTMLRQHAPDLLPPVLRSDAPVSVVFFPAPTTVPGWSIASILPPPEGMPAPHAVALAATIENGALTLQWHGQTDPFEGMALATLVSRTMQGLRELVAGGKDQMSALMTQLDMSGVDDE
uniref:Polyketide synthase SpiC2 n=1 Tax=Pseudomonas sp. Q71576 TaxID=1231908 RepID=V5IZL2_9PSED|nr:polyketide synthase SpiC2 [Pseudomonas sp. Q71576]